MAIGIWLTVSRATPASQAITGTTTTYTDVTVLPVSGDANVHQAQVSPQTVTVTVRGAREVMDRMEGNQIHAFVNLTGLSSAVNLARDVEVALPRGTTIVGIEPPQVIVSIPKQP